MRLFNKIAFAALLCGLTAPAHAAMDDYKFVKLQALDKSTAKTETFVAEVGSTIQYGPLFIKIQSCRKAQPIDKPESASFVQIWEVPHGAEKSTWIFSGWMFASSPALAAMDHPVYDVWVLDCQNDKSSQDNTATSPSEAQPKAQDELTPAASVSSEVPEAASPDAAPAVAEQAPQAGQEEPAPAPVVKKKKKPVFKQGAKETVDYGLGSWAPPE